MRAALHVLAAANTLRETNMVDFIKALPGIAIVLAGIASLASAVYWMMTGTAPFGDAGTFGAIVAYVVAALLTLKLFTY